MGRAIGIDLGTTNSCAAVIDGTQPKVIMYRGGSYTVPSLFAVDEGGQMLVGHDAKKQAALNPEGTVFASKRVIGRSYHSPQVEKVRQVFTQDMVEGEDGEVLLKVQGKVFDLKQVSAEILKKIKDVAQDYLDTEVTSTVITVPAYFNEKQRRAIAGAGELADLQVLRILNEPTAAALAYGLGKSLRQRIVVFDLGGGTLDLSVVDIKDKVFEVVAAGGDAYLGGIDFDDRLIAHLVDLFEVATGVEIKDDKVAVQRIREAAERAKISLSSRKRTSVEIPFIARGAQGILDLEASLTRPQLEAMTEDLVDRSIEACRKLFLQARIDPKSIDEVLLVGGQSRMPLVQQRVTELFGRSPCKGVHPDEAVAVGAAIMAHSLSRTSAQAVHLKEVLPLPIGLAKGDGSFLPLFPKGCALPHVRRLSLTNSRADQKTIMLKLLQGEAEQAADNELLGSFVFEGFVPAPRGQAKIQVWIGIDSSGTLEVVGRDKATGQPVTVQRRTADGMGPAALFLSTESLGGELLDSDEADNRRAQAEESARAEARDAGDFEQEGNAGATQPMAAGATTQPMPEPRTEENGPLDPLASETQGSQLPEAAGADEVTRSAEEVGCLSLLLPWNWWK